MKGKRGETADIGTFQPVIVIKELVELLFTLGGMALVASSTTTFVQQVAKVALKAQTDYFDVQYSSQKVKELHSMEARIKKAFTQVFQQL
jgi:hypothetical protein